VEPQRAVRDPHEAFAADGAALAAARVLLDVHEVELARGEAPREVAALADRELEVDLRIQLPEIAQNLREVSEGEVVGGAEAQASAHGRADEVGGGLIVRREDRAREA